MLTILTNKPDLVSVDCKVATTADDLSGGDTLIACCTGVIVSPEILARYRQAYNIHPAPNTYPGRDPHHWAFYDGVKDYGVTLHRMTEKVDAGEIIKVIEFPITQNTPGELRLEADRRAFDLLNAAAREILSGQSPKPGSRVEWRGPKRTRRNLIAMCDFSNLSPEEVDRRKFAFQGFEAHFKEV
ncbi:MAG: hypothetical protein JJ878_06470 [Alphaproteobacteria bacterium]|nr:hypothetical protein [Alphaproteobacteria bacterium]MBO6862264.1 hypothetical protein [Alphaproteobacteria bacterium]